MTNRQLDEEAIFHIAREIPLLQVRARYLDQICVGDQPLRERVEVATEGSRARAGVPQSAAHPIRRQPQRLAHLTERPGATIGRYRLMEQIGEGGIGIVYVAEQEKPLRRKVALKVIKPGMDIQGGDRSLRGRAAGAGHDGPREHCQGLRRWNYRYGPPYFVMELGARCPDHGVLRPEQAANSRATGAIYPGMPSDSARAPEGDHPS